MVLTRTFGAALAGAWLAMGASAAAAQSTGAASSRSAYAYSYAGTQPVRAAAPDGASQQVRAGWLGIGLSCSNCRLNSAGKSVPRWVFTMPPAIYSVDHDGPADRAGLRRGDTLLTIDGQPLVSAEGGEAFANLRPGIRVRLGYLRDARERTVNVTPIISPTLRQLAVRDSQVLRAYTESAAWDAARVQREIERVQRDMERVRGRQLTDSMAARIRASLDEVKRSLRAPQPFVIRPPAAALPTTPSPSVAPTAPSPPVAAWSFSGPSRLRYAGRVGNVSVEARRPGAVNVVENGDSVVVLNGGDLTVRVVVDRGGGVPSVSAAGNTIRTSSGDVAYGVTGYLVNPRLGQALGVRGGVLALSVEPDSHADSLGIVPGDVVVELNDEPAVAITPTRTTGRAQPGALTAVVVRDRERRELRLPSAPPRARSGATPSARPARPAATPRPAPRPPSRGVPPVPPDTV